MGMTLDRVNFLVVDDNDHMRRLVRLILRSMGAVGTEQVREARNGEDALDQIKNGIPDIIVTDWEMAPMDGLELTRFIRRSRNSPNVFMPVIMMTGYAERERVFTARDTGVTEFLVKPLSAQSLYSRIAAIIEKPRQFVRVGQFFGPDRRRRKENWNGDDRRGAPAPRPAGPRISPQTPMTQKEINSLFNP